MVIEIKMKMKIIILLMVMIMMIVIIIVIVIVIIKHLLSRVDLTLINIVTNLSWLFFYVIF
jgi:hypothetical protein